MKYTIQKFLALLTVAVFLRAQSPEPAAQQPSPENPATGARELFVTVGKSLLVDSPTVIRRVSVANGTIAEAIATSPREVLVNGKAPGETSLIVWQDNGNRLIFDLVVQANPARLDAINRELHTELPGDNVSITLEDGVPFLRGTTKDLTEADRAVLIASTLGRPVNLLRVNVPPVEAQILIKVRFIDVDRTHSQQLGINLFSTGALNTPGSVTTGAFTPPQINVTPTLPGVPATTTLSLTNALNIFLFRPDLNLGATIQALAAQSWLQILAEPNVLTINNRSASFLAGGEFPFPTLQGGGAGLGAVTIQFREFGVRINFTPTVTPRGTIRLQVTPEVSSLDFANGLTFQGFTIPGLSTRRVQTEIELESGQSFAIGGLLDNRLTDQLSKIPGLGDIPFFGKLFRSRTLQKNNSELLIIVTPEIVRPIPSGQPLPSLKFPFEFMQPNTASTPPRTPGIETTGPVPVHPPQETLPVEQLMQSTRPQGAGAGQQGQPAIQFVPMLVPPTQPQPETTPAARPPAPATPPPAQQPAQSPTPAGSGQ
ncbi:MAG TPA: pilus assembly protein N-terminal domain-containing protein [Bryobacteraceae bacterium]|nr:pilus assembly protein N-terminal domain-containing protein [Bryobacteraceae bacterium]